MFERHANRGHPVLPVYGVLQEHPIRGLIFRVQGYLKFPRVGLGMGSRLFGVCGCLLRDRKLQGHARALRSPSDVCCLSRSRAQEKNSIHSHKTLLRRSARAQPKKQKQHPTSYGPIQTTFEEICRLSKTLQGLYGLRLRVYGLGARFPRFLGFRAD